MLSVNTTVVHLQCKVHVPRLEVNALLEWAFAERHRWVEQILAQLLEQAQEEALQAVERCERTLVCTRCGVEHAGALGWGRRGWRMRQLKSRCGLLRFRLRQITCGECGKTCVPWSESLGLAARQRLSAPLQRCLIERVCDQSYRRSVQTARACLGVGVSPSTLHRLVQSAAARVRLTPDRACRVVVADGTKVPAGGRAAQEELRLALQVQGRRRERGRGRVQLRLIGLDVGRSSWPAVLRQARGAQVVTTDAEPALISHVKQAAPEAEHRLCSWHVGYTMEWSLLSDGVRVKRRRTLQARLRRILGSPNPRWRAVYTRFVEHLVGCETTRRQLRDALPRLEPNPDVGERTTSVVERQMREINRRVDVGVRWSTSGVKNLMLLSFTQKHNPDDYERVWT